jgi:hypothetical protein
MVYTALHEYAHHLHSCKNGGKLPVRSHTQEFWSIFHTLLEKAEAKKLYSNVYVEQAELSKLTELIRSKYIKQNGALFIELGESLIAAKELCDKEGLRFEDYIDRILCIPRLVARMAMKSFNYDLDPALGADNMRFVSAIRGEEERAAAENSLLSGKSPDSVKVALRQREDEEDPRERLEKERSRLERTITTLSKRLKEIEHELEGTN